MQLGSSGARDDVGARLRPPAVAVPTVSCKQRIFNLPRACHQGSPHTTTLLLTLHIQYLFQSLRLLYLLSESILHSIDYTIV